MPRSLQAPSSPPAGPVSKGAGPAASQNSGTPPVAILSVALLAVVLWGASPIATKLAVAELDPFAVGALRTLIGNPICHPGYPS